MLLTPLPMSGRGDTIQQQQSLWYQGRTWGLVGTPLTMKNCVFPIKTAPRPASLCNMPTAQPRASSWGVGELGGQQGRVSAPRFLSGKANVSEAAM